ncbi:MAG: hopanoid biosynthesis-associated protein HpnK, partial [Stellaceae bacterium]
SLMVAAPAAADAVARTARLERLRVGLHLVLVSGVPCLPPTELPVLTGGDGRFGDGLLGAGVRFCFSPTTRRELAREIRAQFEAFRATGLALDHVNAHRHMQLHPTVAALIFEIGRDYGMRALRIPHEPLPLLRQAGASRSERAVALGHAPMAALLRRSARRHGLAINDRLLGLAWTGAMSESRVLRLIDALPPGVSELYLHPAVEQSAALARAMPHYRPVDELAALLSPAVRRRIEAEGVVLSAYADLAPADREFR